MMRLSMQLSMRNVLMLTQFLVILPHFGHLPYWLVGLSIIVVMSQLGWVYQRLFARSKLRQRVIQSLVFLSGMLGIFLTFHTLLGVEAGTAFLIICLLGKLFEVNTRRDAYVVLTFGLFITAALFLFDQGLFTALWAMLSTLSVLYAMARQNVAENALHIHEINENVSDLQQSVSSQIRKRSPLTTIALIVMQAIPLMIILFIFFPRMPPFWTIHLDNGSAQTGMSDSMSPGDIAKLSQSTELAFRAIFPKGQMPAKSELYWRGLVLGSFDGRTWRQSVTPQLKTVIWGNTSAIPSWLAHAVQLNNAKPVAYQLIVEPTQQPWMFALNFPFSANSRAGLTREYTLRAADDIIQQTTFELYKFDAKVVDEDLPVWIANEALKLPVQGNPKSRAFAERLFTRLNRNPELYANAVIKWISHENFVYTLQPPPLEGDRIDQFLFQTRRGFCEHYASSFTFLMRAAGIPARVVVGYQGGQLGRDGKSLEVRQMDAHAWSEVWLAGRGWVRFDPTAAVAPDRVERGMKALTADNSNMFGAGVAGAFRYNQFKMLGQAREWVDYAKYMWQQKVVGFDEEQQGNFLYHMFGLRSQMMQVLVMVGAFVAVLLVVVGVMWWRRRPVWHVLDAPLIKLSKRLEKQNLARESSEGVLTWLKRVGSVPHYEAPAKELAAIYSQARYAQNNADQLTNKIVIKQFQQLVKNWRIRS